MHLAGFCFALFLVLLYKIKYLTIPIAIGNTIVHNRNYIFSNDIKFEILR